MNEPLWLKVDEILAIHEEILSIHGGGIGVRDQKLLESALDRPKNFFHYEKRDLSTLAAAYADGMVNNHPFVDGNKRIGFLAAALFIECNGYQFVAPEAEVVTMILGLAANKTSKEELAIWLRDSSRKAPS